MEKVIAVVVTYNRKKLLTECITAIRNQTHPVDKILVINNGSIDGTEAWLRKQPDIDFITQKNTGSAGGFFTGIKKAFKETYNWMWLMDDDGYPKEDALEKLLAAKLDDLCLRTCAVINKEDKKSFVWKTHNFKTIDEVKEKLLKNNIHPFNGTLLHRKIVERVGFPNPRLFLWGDETEYYFRIIKKNGIPAYTILDSIHYHPAAAFSYKNNWDFHTAWKMYYYVRNRFYIMKTQYSFSWPLAICMYIVFLTFYAVSVVIYQKTDRIKKLEFILWPAKDALTDNLNVTPSLILEKLRNRQSSQFMGNAFKHFKSMGSLRHSHSPVHKIIINKERSDKLF
jgi:rhamnopyranosyl-N-acetylglucosaminyl-diphospho-decaprenol beta-1,3/1,4-galactofuranosyltransferase